MKKLAAWLITVSALTSGCAVYSTPHHDPDSEQKGAREPVDRNRNGVPDSLERKAAPTEPIIDRAGKSAD